MTPALYWLAYFDALVRMIAGLPLPNGDDE